MECDIPFETSEGNKYILSFTLFNQSNVPIKTPIIDISLVSINQISLTNSIRTFNYITTVISDYIINKNVILYYYCDVSEIFYRGSRKIESYQEYRFNLFNSLFHKVSNPDLFIKNIIIDDELNGNHYISLIYKENSKEEIEQLAIEIAKLQK